MVSQTTSRVCVVPTSATGADLLSVVDNKITDRTHIEADGAQHDVKRQGCAGWESAEWSSDGRRLYMTSNQKCDAVDAAGRVISVDVVSAGLERRASGMFAIAPDGKWTNVVNVSASGGQGLRVIRYTPARVDSMLPDEIVKALGNREMFFGTARIGARANVTVENVIEASRKVEPQVVDAWIAMSQEKFNLNASSLVRLADSGVPSQTIDVMIAVSNPGVFAVAANAGGVSTSGIAAPMVASRATRNECLNQIMDPWGYYYDYGCDPYRGFGYRDYYGFDPYYNPYSRYGLGYNGYDYGYSYGYTGRPVVVYVIGSPTDPNAVAAKHGHMTKNGYTSSPSTTSSSGSSGRSGSSSSSSGSSSPSSSSSSSSSSGSSSARTAHPKPPAP
jgi:hypothetical protein